MCRIYLFQKSGRAFQKNENIFTDHAQYTSYNIFLEYVMKISRICGNRQKCNGWYFIRISLIKHHRFEANDRLNSILIL